MLGTFIAAIALLGAMVYLIIRPFIWAPKTTSADVAHEAIPVPVYAAATATVAEAATASVEAPVVTPETEVVDAPSDSTVEPEVAPAASPEAGDDLRLRVEALIAARKAEMSAPKCPTCQTAIAPSDAFCRSCGTKLN